MKSRLFLLHLVISFLLLGVYAISAQVLFIREFLVVFYGNELCFGILFAVWLSGITFGAFLGSKIIGRVHDTFRLFLILQAIMCVLLPFQIYLARITGTFFEVPPGEYLSFSDIVYGSLISILPFSSVIGFAFPFACKTFLKKGRREATGIGWVYVFESAGSMIGGVALTFYLITYFQTFQIIMILSLALLANCFVLSVLSVSKGMKFSFTVLFLCLFVAYMVLLFSMKIEKIEAFSVEKRWNAFHRGLKLLESIDSRYQNLTVGYGNGQYNFYGNGQYITSSPDAYRSATFAHFVLSEHPHPDKVLLIGGGAGGVIKEMLKHHISVLHYVELDPQLIRVIKRNLPPEDKSAFGDERVKIFSADGRYFVKKSPEKYDMIIVNLPDPSTAMLNRFYTVDFFKEAKMILKKDGVFVTGVSSTVNYIGREIGDYSGSVYHSLLEIFPIVLATPGEKHYFFATSSPGVITSDVEILSHRYNQRHIESDYFSKYHFAVLLPQDRIRFLRQSLSERSSFSINTDFKPITYYYNLILWDIYSGERDNTNVFISLRAMNLRMCILLLVFFVVIRTVYVVFKGERLETHLRFNCLFAIMTTGFAGMSLEIILIFAFQNIYGYIYQMIGLIIAIFMIGLALGGWAMNRMIQKESARWIGILAAIEISLAVYSFILPYIIRDIFPFLMWNIGLRMPSEYLFISLIVIVGILTGSQFPLISKIMIERKGEPGRVAGIVDSLDHMGAFLGALIIGAAFVPLLGIQETCFFIGAFKVVSIVFLTTYIVLSISSNRWCFMKHSGSM
ncbi:MAG: fused MFS/spermidine synthase [Thermodesulfobacteriota bacterium]|nr:fused MFS/spermidine synthase [Thermodesulfobacteriota bacterium]